MCIECSQALRELLQATVHLRGFHCLFQKYIWGGAGDWNSFPSAEQIGGRKAQLSGMSPSNTTIVWCPSHHLGVENAVCSSKTQALGKLSWVWLECVRTWCHACMKEEALRKKQRRSLLLSRESEDSHHGIWEELNHQQVQSAGVHSQHESFFCNYREDNRKLSFLK